MIFRSGTTVLPGDGRGVSGGVSAGPRLTQARAGAGAPTTTGRALAAARREKGLTVEDAARWLRIEARFLVALEEGRESALPSRAHALGFVRVYAGCVGLDGDAVVALYREEVRPDPSAAATPAWSARARWARPRAWTLAAAFLATAIVYGVWRLSAPPPAPPEVSAPPARLVGGVAGSPVGSVSPDPAPGALVFPPPRPAPPPR